MMRTHHQKESQRGIALLMVLISLVVISVMTVDFIESNEVYLASAVQHRDSVKAEYLARSAVNLSRLMISVQGTPMLAELGGFPFWKYADMLLEPFNTTVNKDGDPIDPDDSDADGESGSLLGDMAGIDLSSAEGLGLPEGNEFSVSIVDEESKLNLNLGASMMENRKTAVRLSLRAMVESPMYDGLFDMTSDNKTITREDVVNEIFDFVDPDQEGVGGAGGEEAYYSGTVPEYRRKNAPFDSLQELHLVHGVGDDFWTAFVEPDPENPDTRVMTVWGTGKVNVNTANAQVLMASLCNLATDEESGLNPCIGTVQRDLAMLLQQFMFVRSFMPSKSADAFLKMINDPSSDPILSMMTGLSGGTALVGFPLNRKAQVEGKALFTTTSEVFSIYAEGEVGNAVKRIHAVIHSNPKDPDMLDPKKNIMLVGGKVLYWRME